MARGVSYSERVEQAAAKVDRLPVWAQDYIAHLKRQASSATRELDEIRNPPGDANVFVSRLGLRDEDQKLGRDLKIRFQLPGQTVRMDSITVAIRGGKLEIHGDDRIVIEPNSTNHAFIRLER